MKKRAEEGFGLQTRKAEVISVHKEEYLWTSGLLGDSSPTCLLDTLVFLLGLNFALRSGEEHRTLSRDQLKVCHSLDGALAYLLYTEKFSKTNRRGLKDYNVNRKIVRAYADLDNPSRCVVALYQKYLSLCPDVPQDGPVYLSPLKRPTEEKWFSSVPVGKNTLAKTVSKLCQQAGFEGKFIRFLYFKYLIYISILCSYICLFKQY
jgi:hypothetical protein